MRKFFFFKFSVGGEVSFIFIFSWWRSWLDEHYINILAIHLINQVTQFDVKKIIYFQIKYLYLEFTFITITDVTSYVLERHITVQINIKLQIFIVY